MPTKRMALLVMLVLFVSLFPAHVAQGSYATPATSTLADLLNPDGSLKLTGGVTGELTLDGWQVHLDPARGPIVTPAPAGQWYALGDMANGALEGMVAAIAVSGTDVYVGGYFRNAAGIAAADYIARWDGQQWHALGANRNGDGVLNDAVTAIAVSGTDVYVGGWFTNAAGIATADHIAKWDGTNWHALGSNGSGDGAINSGVAAIAVSATGVYAGGFFENAAGIFAADYIARWDGTNWHALGSDSSGDGVLNNAVRAIAISEPHVYAGGDFQNAAGIAAADYVAAWDGVNWRALGSTSDGDGVLNGVVFALAVRGTSVLVGGYFDNAAGIAAADRIAAWDGAGWRALGSNNSGDGALKGEVFAIAVVGEAIYVGGNFRDAAGIATADYLAVWEGDTWRAAGDSGSGNNAINYPVYALAVRDRAIYAGGEFTNAAGLATADYITEWDGMKWQPLGSFTNGALNNVVTTIATNGTDVYVGGWFTDVAGIPAADYVARWDGQQWHALGSNGSGDGAINNPVYALAVSGTDVYVGGTFENAAGIPAADRIAKWDGVRWHALGSNGSGDGAIKSGVLAIAVSGTDVYAGGFFENAAGIAAADNIAKWDGANWHALGADHGEGALNGLVAALAVDGTDVYVGGVFQNVAGIATADYLAKWDGERWSAIGDNGSGDGALNGAVRAIAISESVLYAGGFFTNAAGIAQADYLARWDGRRWSALGGLDNGAFNDSVAVIAVNGTDVYVGGEFRNAAGIASADYVAKWDGRAWRALGSNGSGDGAMNRLVSALAVSGKDVFVGGFFRDAAGIPAADYVARWSEPEPSDHLAPGLPLDRVPGYDSTPAVGSTINVGLAFVGESTTTTLTIRETGNATLRVTTLAMSGPHAAEFTVAPEAFTIADGGAAQTVTIGCAPQTSGLLTATLAVYHNATGSPALYPLRCIGLWVLERPAGTDANSSFTRSRNYPGQVTLTPSPLSLE